jgi:hypothetical protein
MPAIGGENCRSDAFDYCSVPPNERKAIAGVIRECTLEGQMHIKTLIAMAVVAAILAPLPVTAGGAAAGRNARGICRSAVTAKNLKASLYRDEYAKCMVNPQEYK